MQLTSPGVILHAVEWTVLCFLLTAGVAFLLIPWAKKLGI